MIETNDAVRGNLRSSAVGSLCPSCGRALPPEVDAGPCPRCLLGALEMAAEPEIRDAAEPESPGALPSIPHYSITRRIGAGGMGAVYEAEQAHPRRTVALKLVRSCLSSERVMRRFELEAEALGRLQHPSVAHVYESGVAQTDSGPRPFFAMELVRGPGGARAPTLIEYAEQQKLSVRQRLELIARVADAVHHAHQRGVIHRDLKPGNILVDQSGLPKIVDFGVARVTDCDVQATTHLTSAGQIVGTLAYMSPEQAAGNAAEVDTRCDVYALGIVCYELLGGRLPYSLDGMMIHQAVRVVIEQEPAPLGSLDRALRGDITIIAAKAMEKDKARRYGSAAELATDIRRVLDYQPIMARRPTAAYQLARLAQRHKAVVAGAAALVLILGLGVVAAWINTSRAANALDARRNLYYADMNLTGQVLEDGSYGRARELLRVHRPDRGEHDLRGFEWRYFSTLARGDQLFALRGHSGPVTSVAFGGTGSVLASGSVDETVRVWDVAGRAVARVFPVSHGVTSVAFSADGSVLAAGCGAEGKGGGVYVWRRADGTELLHLSTGPARIALSPAGTLLAIAPGGAVEDDEKELGDVSIWDLSIPIQVAVLPAAGTRATFSPDGNTLATGPQNGTIKLWDVKTWHSRLTIPDAGKVICLGFSRDGSTLAATTWANEVKLWNARDGKPLEPLPDIRDPVYGLAFSPTVDGIATGGGDQALRLWDLASRREVWRLGGHGNEVRGVAFSPDGRTLASGGKDGAVMLWGVAPKGEPQVLQGLVTNITFSQDGARLAARSENPNDPTDSTVTVWDLNRRSPVRTFPNAGFPILFLNDGSLLTSVDDKFHRLIDVDRGAVRMETAPPGVKWLGKAAVTPDGRMLVFGDMRGDVVLLDASSEHLLGTFRAHSAQIRQLVLSPDGKVVATASDDRTARLWDLARRKELANLAGHGGKVWDVAFSPDGKTVATAGFDNTIRLWDVPAGNLQAVLSGHKREVLAVHFAPDGRTLASGSEDGTLKLWNVAARREVATIRHPAGVGDVEFSPDGLVLASYCWNRSLYLRRALSLVECERLTP